MQKWYNLFNHLKHQILVDRVELLEINNLI